VLKPHFYLCCRALAAVCAVLWLASCTTTPQPIDADASEQAKVLWGQHQQQLTSYSQWSIKGRAALRSDSDSWSAALTWKQYDDSYEVRLAGPFGKGAVNIDGNDEQVSVHIAGRQAVVSNDPELLLSQHLGWTVPIESLAYWLRGLPAPGKVDALILDQSGVISHLEQQGWRIDYSAYRPLKGVSLPRKIQIEDDSLRLKLVLDRWRLGKEQGVAARR